MWGAWVRDQVFRRELHTYIHLDYIRVKFMSFFKKKRKEKKKGYIYDTTAHNWYDDHFTSISTCEVWRVRVEVQISRKKFHIHIHLN